MKYNHIWVLDDREHGDRDSFGEQIGEIFTGSRVRNFQSSWQARESLQRVKPANIPEIMFFDAFAFMDTTKGFSEFEDVFTWLKDHRPDHLPKYAVFMSADLGYANQCKELAIESHLLPPEKIYAIGKGELFPASRLIKKERRSGFRDEEDGECRVFLNHALGLNLPVTRERYSHIWCMSGKSGWLD